MSANRIGPARPPRQPPLGGFVDGENLALRGHQQDLVLARVQQRAHANLALPQGSFGFFALGDVGRHAHHQPPAAVIAPEWRRGECPDARPAVGGADEVLALVHRLVERVELVDVGPHHLLALAIGAFRPGGDGADLLAGIAGQLQPGLAEMHHFAVLGMHHDREGGVLHRAPQPRLALAQCLLGTLASTDILDDGDAVRRIAGLVALHRGRQVDPDGMAVLVKVSLLQVVCVDLSAHQGREPVEIERKVFGVRHLLKVLLQKLGAAVPEDVTEALIDPQPGAVRSDIGDADGGVLERTAKTGLAFAQRVLGFLARGDVEVEADP